jgi:hypothetical protein
MAQWWREESELAEPKATGDATNLFAAIEEWWGEPLSEELIQRIISAPRDHYDAFQKNYTYWHAEPVLAELPLGRLRPLSYDLSELLYAHEVVLFDPILQGRVTLTFDPEILGRKLRQALAVAPLFHDGQVHFISPDFPAFGPDRSLHPIIASVLAAARTALASVADGSEDIRSALADDDIDLILGSTALGRELRELAGAISHCARHQSKIQFGLSELQHLVLSGIVPDIAADPETVRLGDLIQLRLPDSGIPIEALVKLRRTGSAFEEWRHLVTPVLADVGELLAARGDITEARTYASTHLAEVRKSMERELANAGPTGLLRRGGRTITISAMGIAAGTAFGHGAVAGPIAGGVSAGLASIFLDFLQGRDLRSSRRAILELCLVFGTAGRS